jgi:hypothetical protein
MNVSTPSLPPSVNACALVIECTLSGLGNHTGCQPAGVAEHRDLLAANMAAVILVGTVTNTLTLAALPYAIFRWLPARPSVPRYPAQFPWLGGGSTVLLLHLSLCDFLYCTLGLPFLLSTLLHGHFEYGRLA